MPAAKAKWRHAEIIRKYGKSWKEKVESYEYFFNF